MREYAQPQSETSTGGRPYLPADEEGIKADQLAHAGVANDIQRENEHVFLMSECLASRWCCCTIRAFTIEHDLKSSLRRTCALGI